MHSGQGDEVIFKALPELYPNRLTVVPSLVVDPEGSPDLLTPLPLLKGSMVPKGKLSQEWT